MAFAIRVTYLRYATTQLRVMESLYKEKALEKEKKSSEEEKTPREEEEDAGKEKEVNFLKRVFREYFCFL